MAAVLFVLQWPYRAVLNQWRGHLIVAKAGLPELPEGAWITYANIKRHDLLFEEVALGFSAPSRETDEWIATVEGRGFDADISVLGHSVRRWSSESGADFSASLSYK